MSLTYLEAVSTRAADCLLEPGAPSSLGDDEASLVLGHCDAWTRGLASLVCKSWQALARPELHATIGGLPRRLTAGSLVRFATRWCGDQTLKLDLANMRSLDDSTLRHILIRTSSLSGDDSSRGDGAETAGARRAVECARARMPSLRHLDLSACDVGDAAFRDVEGGSPASGVSLASLGVFAQLRTLCLWAVSELSNAGLALLAACAPCLEAIDLRMCGEVDGEGVCGMARRCPRLLDVRSEP